MRAAARRFGRKTWSYALGAAAAAARALRGPGARCHPPSGPQSFLQHPFYLDFAYFTKLLSIGIVGNVRGGGRERGALCVERATSVTCGAAAASMSPRASIRAKREKNFRGIKSAARRYGPPEGRAARARAARRAARDFAGRTKSLARTLLLAACAEKSLPCGVPTSPGSAGLHNPRTPGSRHSCFIISRAAGPVPLPAE